MYFEISGLSVKLAADLLQQNSRYPLKNNKTQDVTMQNAFPHLCNDRTLNESKVALVEGDKRFTYFNVNQRIDRVATGLLAGQAIKDLNEERIAFFMPASLDYVATMHGVWRAGGIAVPLNVASAVVELEHYLSSA
ncbi:MAG: AMP-binding protein, partial [Psychrosphaera sp.]|nr:AMP-binding protein [Psychrosphaera sp.]